MKIVKAGARKSPKYHKKPSGPVKKADASAAKIAAWNRIALAMGNRLT